MASLGIAWTTTVKRPQHEITEVQTLGCAVCRKMYALMNRQPGDLIVTVGTVPREEENNYRVAMNAVCAPNILPKLREDLRIYMEACHYC